jgi:hypothetical protein
MILWLIFTIFEKIHHTAGKGELDTATLQLNEVSIGECVDKSIA